MEKYRKPKCDCGNYLTARRSEYWSVERAITSDGELSNRVIKIGTGIDDSDYEIRLHCRKCGNQYECEYDDKDRIIRGSLKSQYDS